MSVSFPRTTCHVCMKHGIPRSNKFCSRKCFYAYQRKHPHTFVKYHCDLVTVEARIRQAKAIAGTGNGRWKGHSAGYVAKHNWMRKHFGRPMTCEKCGKTKTTPNHMHWANISGRYLRKRSDWKRLCARCHKRWDMERAGTMQLGKI